MKINLPPVSLLGSLALLAASGLSAQTIYLGTGGDSLWSNAANWSPSVVPDDNATTVRLQGSPTVDGDYTVNTIQNAFGSIGNTTSGSGTLTIDRNSASTGNGIINVTGNSGGVLTFNSKIRIHNSLGGVTRIGFANSDANSVVFGTGSVLTLDTILETDTESSGRAIHFNGQIAGGTSGAANLRFGSNDSNIYFGAGADNSAYAGDFVAFSANVVSDTLVTGGFLSGGSKLQVNGTGGSLQLNGANSMAGNLVIDGANVFTLDVNAGQDAFGIIAFSGTSPTATLTLDVDAAVGLLAFADSSAYDWADATITIIGFRENTIRFGTDDTGLTADQLAAIDGGIYSLDAQGYLTIPEPGACALIAGLAGFVLILRRRRVA